MSLLNAETAFSQTEQVNHEGHESPSEFKGIVADITESLNGISLAFEVYNKCSNRLLRLPPQYPAFQKDVALLSQDIKRQEQNQKDTFDQIEKTLEDDIRKEVLLALEDQLIGVIREEVANMVRAEVDEQIREHLPISLSEQAEESKKQLNDIKISLNNSAARMHNSFIELGYLEDPLRQVLTPNGDSSPYYPPNLKMLFAYDLDTVKALNKDYGLVESDNIRLHFHQFLRHVGANVEVVTHDDEEQNTELSSHI